jgi:hypothetical protein
MFRGAYSVRYIDVRIPKIKAKGTAIDITANVPTQAERIPASSGLREGKEKKNFKFNLPKPSANISATTAIIKEATSIRKIKETARKTQSANLINFSLLISSIQNRLPKLFSL